MVINPELLGLINIILTVAGGMYGARLLYKQIIGKNQGDATHTLSETIIDQNTLIERLQDRNQSLNDLNSEYQTKMRNTRNALAFIANRYKAYAPAEVQASDLEQMASLVRGDSGPLKTQ